MKKALLKVKKARGGRNAVPSRSTMTERTPARRNKKAVKLKPVVTPLIMDHPLTPIESVRSQSVRSHSVRSLEEGLSTPRARTGREKEPKKELKKDKKKKEPPLTPSPPPKASSKRRKPIARTTSQPIRMKPVLRPKPKSRRGGPEPGTPSPPPMSTSRGGRARPGRSRHLGTDGHGHGHGHGYGNNPPKSLTRSRKPDNPKPLTTRERRGSAPKPLARRARTRTLPAVALQRPEVHVRKVSASSSKPKPLPRSLKRPPVSLRAKRIAAYSNTPMMASPESDYSSPQDDRQYRKVNTPKTKSYQNYDTLIGADSLLSYAFAKDESGYDSALEGRSYAILSPSASAVMSPKSPSKDFIL